MATQTKHLESIGHLCQSFQRSYGSIKRTLEEIGAEPELTINGIPHYGEEQIEALAERLQQASKPERRQ
jgi:hypothetical protein